jgi:VIT1/CCC1 family predicted Fe2+/Mn2+ transporter
MTKKINDFENHDEVVAHRKSIFGKYEAFVPEFVYGGIDGAVTTFAVVAAAAGAELGAGVVLILGISNMLADGLSMSIGSFLSTKSEVEQYDRIEEEEYAETEKFPEAETQEIRAIYAAKGFSGHTLENIVSHIVSNKKLWVNEMMLGEHGLIREEKHPSANALMTFTSFCILGFIPISPYVYAFVRGIDLPNAFIIACFSTAVAFVIIGYLKGLVNQTNKIRAVVETLFLGGIAAGVAYGVGDWLEKLIGA